MAESKLMAEPKKTVVVNVAFEVFDVYAGRGNHKYRAVGLGNPFNTGTRETNIANFARLFAQRIAVDKDYRALVESARGKRLGCHCAPLPCHADFIAQWLNSLTGENT